MAQHFKPDPYNGFKTDIERRRALNTKVFAQSAVAVAFILSDAPSHLMQKLQWLKNFFS